ncbi:MAG: hypothetical protein VW907_09080, partial [Opitutae bacterium]
MKKIEPPGSLASSFIPNCPKQAATVLLADLWVQKKCPVAIVIGESLPDAENKCEDIAALVESLYPGFPVCFHSFDRPQAIDHPDAFEKTCERLSLLSSLREIATEDGAH